MTTYEAPIPDIQFVLNDVLRIDRFSNLPGFCDVPSDVLEAILVEAGRFSEEVLHPLNRIGDVQGCERKPDGSVTTPEGFGDAFKRLGQGGWIGLSAPAEYGGQGLPTTISHAVNEMLVSANMSLEICASLSRGAIAALLAHGSDDQRRLYLPKLISGEWTGTMNLTEPHCGTDLGMLRTTATKQTDDSYQITGTKIFITCGEHDLAQNIIHLVLARAEGAPAGIHGVSLFVVPKYLVSPYGTVEARNAVSCGSIEHKMGLRGSSTCVMNYEDARGWLVGKENKGMEAMFVMMNEARLSVGQQALAQSEVAYQNAANYARDRLQGRALDRAQSSSGKPADPIIVHPDVRRTLLTIRAFNEAARAFILWTSLKSDVAERTENASAKQKADDQLGLLTPVIKGMLSDKGFANTVMAQQMFGGHGYIAETGMEQFVRDARITMLYEGANGVQALDLVARKLARNDGRAIKAFIDEVRDFINHHSGSESIKPLGYRLETALVDLEEATGFLMRQITENASEAVSGSTDYMHLLGLVALGYMWTRMAQAAHDKIAAGHRSLHIEAKRVTARFFMSKILPETAIHLIRIRAGGTDVMGMPAEAF